MSNWAGKAITITGGCGYVGRRLAIQLLRQGAHKIVLFDLREINMEWFEEKYHNNIEFCKYDICDYNLVKKAISNGNHCVFHLCSYGMSGREQLNTKKIEQINCAGTQNVINACIELNVTTLVYTSTTNVCFNGNPLINEDENLPYANKFIDSYSRTKCIAEKLIIKANGSILNDNSNETLKTCSIRPAGIYGEGEERHIPRIIEIMKKHLFFFTIGSKSSKVEFVYIDNLVSAHIRAAERLLMLPLSKHQNPRIEFTKNDVEILSVEKAKEIQEIVSGQVYFISDWDPINNFEFFRPLIEGLGHWYPFVQFPVFLMFYFAWFVEIIHWIVSPIFNFQPITRTEIHKVSVTHYFKPDKSRDELGYYPFVSTKEGMDRTVEFFKNH